GLAAAAVSGVDPSGLLHMAPALILAFLLLARRYPGERLIARLSSSARRPRPHRRASAVKPRTRFEALTPRGGLLLGRSLAVRPPPIAARASSRPAVSLSA